MRYANLDERVEQIKSEDVFQTFLDTYATAIEPHTNYMTPRTTENFNIAMRLSLEGIGAVLQRQDDYVVIRSVVPGGPAGLRSEEHTSELQSLMRNSYAVFCLKK